jgi:precorrin isomerase
LRIAKKELLTDCNIFVNATLISRTPDIDTDSTIVKLAEGPIENLSSESKYHIINRLVTASADSELGRFVRIDRNYHNILRNITDKDD